MLCSACQEFIDSILTKAEMQPLAHHETCRSLECAVKAGCYACNRLWAILPSDARDWIRTEASTSSILPHSAILTAGSTAETDDQKWILGPMTITHALRPYQIRGHEGEELFQIVVNPRAFPFWISPRLRPDDHIVHLRPIPCTGTWETL
ncbi:hypothetical protein BDP81DRAFT_51613 [Colletotrichum phormii]|uniref:Uncharacterized protein n=1 Tax=Colletotrichum phormii TaxID=359342 RepID=A0AAJ0EDH0_9PEZI|nr:uncharacterized protein BDP81DRAFT_51613 [Colletotrichum phormii]KAK1634703.1 hypothetical protein BDP81DRAFT_51613 [Colletotrichum phormii]